MTWALGRGGVVGTSVCVEVERDASESHWERDRAETRGTDVKTEKGLSSMYYTRDTRGGAAPRPRTGGSGASPRRPDGVN